MYIGSLISSNSPLKCEYSYKFRGTNVPLNPDFSKEEYNTDIYNKDNGKLFLKGPVGWKTDTILDVGVDIDFNLSSECFLDHIVLTQGENSFFKKIEIIKKEEKSERIISVYEAQTDKIVSDEEVKIFIGYNTDNFIIRVYSAVRNFIIKELEVYGAILDEDRLFPIPEYRENKSDKRIPLSSLVSIKTLSASAVTGAELLKEKLGYFHSMNIGISDNEANAVVFENFGKNDEFFGIPEAYSIVTEEDKVVIYANDKRGFVYGAESFLGIITDKSFPLVTIKDKPSKEFRGIHIYSLPEKKDIEFFKRYVKYMLLPLRYNAMVIEVCGGMRYERHPEITEKWIEACEKYKKGEASIPPHSGCVLYGTLYEKSEVAELVQYIKDLGIEVIPEVQSLGHVEYITNAFPEIAEVPEKKENSKDVDYSVTDKITFDEYPHNYCVSNEKSYEIIFDVIDEIIEVFKPERYVHMGHDEVNEIGVCPVCKNKNPADLLAYHLNALHAHLKKHGLKMMIWSDMLQNITSERTPYLHLDTMSAINKIPKDIVMCDFIWYFNLEHDIEDHLIRNGFDVVIGNLYSSLYPRYDTRIVKPHMIGGLTATWVDTNEYMFAHEGKMYETTYTANMMWHGGYRSDNRLTYNECIKKFLTELRCNIRNEKVAVTDKNYSLEDIVEVPSDINNAASEYNLKEMVYVSKEKDVKININDNPEVLSFLHCTDKNALRICWKPLVKIGEYVVNYEDGTNEIIPLEYGGNICELRRGFGKPLSEAYYRHQGYIGTYFSDPEICSKTDDGKDMTIYRYAWKNPKPDVKITDVTVKKYDINDANIMLFSVDGK